MKLASVLLLTLFVTWLLWSGYWHEPLLLSLGAASCLFVIFVSWRLGTLDLEGMPLWLLPRVLIRYMPWYLKEIVTSNLDVTRRILGGRSRVGPVLVHVDASQKTDLGRVVLANSITLTPGTVSYAMHDGVIDVHAIAQEVGDSLLSGEMDRRVSSLGI